MSYKSLRGALEDLEQHSQLLRIREEVDPHLEMAEIQRRAYLAEAPAILFENVKGSPFQAVSNLFGTREVKILMRLPDGRNVATRQAVHGSAP